MTHNFNAEETKKFFDSQEGHFSHIKSPREELLFEQIIPKLQKNSNHTLKTIDFGCGGGGLLLRLLSNNCDAIGIEKHQELFSTTQQRLKDNHHDPKRVINAGVEGIEQIGRHSQDLIIVMGVFQYLSEHDYTKLFSEIHRALAPTGTLICSFQNALFDLFTFNKYTIDFIEHHIIDELNLNETLGMDISSDLKSLVTNPEFPPYAKNRARDNIFVRTTNPLTIKKELKEKSFILNEKYFYDFHLVPTVIEKKYAEKLSQFTENFQKTRYSEWHGHFTANAFLVECKKIN
jgi:SAM-dependent methyltransferase